jgi:hypothetical protein
MHHASVSAARARDLLVEHKGSLRSIVGDLEQEHRQCQGQGDDGRRASSRRSERGRGKEEIDDAEPDDDSDLSSATAKGA